MRHAARFPVFKPYRVHHHQLFHLLRPHQRVAGRQHAAGRVADNRYAIDTQRFQQRVSIIRQLLEGVLITFRLSGFTETDLVGCHHAIPAGRQRADRAVPGPGAEIFAVHQHHGAAVGLFRLHVQVSHIQRLILRGKGKVFYRPAVVKTFQLLAVGGGIRGYCGGGQRHQQRQAGQSSGQHASSPLAKGLRLHERRQQKHCRAWRGVGV